MPFVSAAQFLKNCLCHCLLPSHSFYFECPQNPSYIYGTDANTVFVSNDNGNAVNGKIVTARLNGIEIRPVENPVNAESTVSTSGTTDITVGLGQTTSLDAKASPATATERLEYISADPNIVAADSKTGQLTGMKLGKTTVKAVTPSLIGNQAKCVTYNVGALKPLRL